MAVSRARLSTRWLSEQCIRRRQRSRYPSSALAAWGTSAIFSSVALAGLSLEGRSGCARILWRFSLILLITGSSSVSADSAFQILGYSSITAALFGLIGGICLILGVVTALLSFLIPPPSNKKDDYDGVLPAQPSLPHSTC